MIRKGDSIQPVAGLRAPRLPGAARPRPSANRQTSKQDTCRRQSAIL